MINLAAVFHFFAHLVRDLTDFLPRWIMFGIHECTKRSVILHIGFAENNVIIVGYFYTPSGDFSEGLRDSSLTSG